MYYNINTDVMEDGVKDLLMQQHIWQ